MMMMMVMSASLDWLSEGPPHQFCPSVMFVCLSTDRSSNDYVDNSHQILHAARKYGGFDAYNCLRDKPEIEIEF